jgi:hypothetical protein
MINVILITKEWAEVQQIQRYKGLGEMNAEQLWETTMDPNYRTLRQVNIDSLAEADRVFSMLMGDEVPPSREFIEKNAVYAKLMRNTIVVVVSNPMDTMTYLALKATGLPKNRIIGMGGALDSSRFKYYLSKALDKPINDISAMVIGGHGDTTMIPLTRLASYNGIPVSEFLSQDQLDKVAADTMVGGATLTGLLGTSAWYAPGASVAYLVDSILNDQKKMIACSVLLRRRIWAK